MAEQMKRIKYSGAFLEFQGGGTATLTREAGEALWIFPGRIHKNTPSDNSVLTTHPKEGIINWVGKEGLEKRCRMQGSYKSFCGL